MTSERPEGGTAQSDEPMSMSALLDQDSTPYAQLRRGDIIEGVVVGTHRDGILVDIGAKSEGVIPENEMRCLQPDGPSRMQVEDKVLVFVLQPESPEGQIILSLDRARGEQGWRVLQEHLDENQAFEGYVTGSNKGGLLVNVEGVNSFVPLSQIASGRPERGSPEATEKSLAEWVGRTLTLKVIELNRRRNRAIVSERAAVQEKRAVEKERLLQELNEGDIRTGNITSIRDFGIFVDVGGADGLVHLSELSWDRTPKSPQELFNIDDEVEVYVLKVDHESKKIALSLRRAKPERWTEIVSGFREGQIVPGQVTKLAPFGAFVRLEGPVEGLVHISELVERRINHPEEIVQEGDIIPVKIVRIEHDRHRLGLSLRQARSKAEEDGWGFNDSGGIEVIPEAAAPTLEAEVPARQEVGTVKARAVEEAPSEAATEGEAESAKATTAAAAVQVDEPPAGAMAAAMAEAGVFAEEETAEAAEPEATAEEEAPADEPVAAEEEAAETAEEEIDIASESRPEGESAVTESGPDALNKVEDAPAEAESTIDEASDSEEGETSE